MANATRLLNPCKRKFPASKSSVAARIAVPGAVVTAPVAVPQITGTLKHAVHEGRSGLAFANVAGADADDAAKLEGRFLGHTYSSAYAAVEIINSFRACKGLKPIAIRLK